MCRASSENVTAPTAMTPPIIPYVIHFFPDLPVLDCFFSPWALVLSCDSDKRNVIVEKGARESRGEKLGAFDGNNLDVHTLGNARVSWHASPLGAEPEVYPTTDVGLKPRARSGVRSATLIPGTNNAV